MAYLLNIFFLSKRQGTERQFLNIYEKQ